MNESGGKKLRDIFSLGTGLVFAAVFIFALLWMSGFFEMFGGAKGLSDGYAEDFEPPRGEPIAQEPIDTFPDPARWTCVWSPTMNENWHDDVLCSRGSEATRPLLLQGWTYVTYEDMVIAAREYEITLNR